MLRETMLQTYLEENPPKEGTRAAASHAVAQEIDTSWKHACTAPDIRDRLIASSTQEEWDALAEEVFAAMLPTIDAAATCGELYLKFLVPTHSRYLGTREPEKSQEPYEALVQALSKLLEAEGYALKRFDETYSTMFGKNSVEALYICW